MTYLCIRYQLYRGHRRALSSFVADSRALDFPDTILNASIDRGKLVSAPRGLRFPQMDAGQWYVYIATHLFRYSISSHPQHIHCPTSTRAKSWFLRCNTVRSRSKQASYASLTMMRPRTVRLGNSGLKVSRIILGCMSYGTPEWQGWVLPEEEAIKHIKFAYVSSHTIMCAGEWLMARLPSSYDHGIQTFDTADVCHRVFAFMPPASSHAKLICYNRFTLTASQKLSWATRLRSSAFPATSSSL